MRFGFAAAAFACGEAEGTVPGIDCGAMVLVSVVVAAPEWL